MFYFIDWIAPTQNGKKAFCKWCKLELVPKHSVLKAHSHTKRHERASPVTENNSQITNKKLFEVQLDEYHKKKKTSDGGPTCLTASCSWQYEYKQPLNRCLENTWSRTLICNAQT